MNQDGAGAAKTTPGIASTEADAQRALGVASPSPLPLLPEFSASTIARLRPQGKTYPQNPPKGQRGLQNFKGGPDVFKRTLQARRMRRTRIKQGQARLAAGHTPTKSTLDRIRALISKVQVYKAKGPDGVDPRTLTHHQADAILVYFTARQPDVTCGAIADLLDRSVKEIRRRRARIIREDAAVMIPDLNTQNAFADLVFVKQTAQEMALAAHDYETYWDIEREYREELVNLGFIPQAPKRIDTRDLRMTLTEQMAEFMHEFGTPNPKELIARLRAQRSLPAAGPAPQQPSDAPGRSSPTERKRTVGT